MILAVTSCNSQTDFEKLKFDTDISSIIKDSAKFEKSKFTNYSLAAYTTENIDLFKYGNISFSNLKLKDTKKNSLISYTSEINLYVDNFKSNKFSGIIIKTENENEGKKLSNYIKTKLGKPLLENYYNKKEHLQASYLWDDKKRELLIYLTQDTKYFSDKQNKFISTELTVFKRGLKVLPDEGNNPENIKKILEENPNALDMIEILKSRFY